MLDGSIDHPNLPAYIKPLTPPLTMSGLKSEPPLTLKAGDEIHFSVAPPAFNMEGIDQHLMDAVKYSMTNHVLEEAAWSRMTKKDYQKLAAAVRAMRKGMLDLNHMTRNDVNAVMEIIIARIGLMLAEDNKSFDSFMFAAACKGTKT